jgi:hypothetical protein
MFNKTRIPIDQIAETFRARHSVEIRSNGCFPSWNSTWVIDGQVMYTSGVKKLLIPMVMKSIGPDPKALKQIIWRILSSTLKQP